MFANEINKSLRNRIASFTIINKMSLAEFKLVEQLDAVFRGGKNLVILFYFDFPSL